MKEEVLLDFIVKEVKMEKQTQDFIDIKFPLGYYINYDPYDHDDETTLRIPLQGKLDEVPARIRGLYNNQDEIGTPKISSLNASYNTIEVIGVGLEIIWIKERNEWILTEYWQKGCNEDTTEGHNGPYLVDDYHANVLRKAYKLKEGKLTTQEILRTSPSELERLAFEEK
jgi:hypothetical protein